MAQTGKVQICYIALLTFLKEVSAAFDVIDHPILMERLQIPTE